MPDPDVVDLPDEEAVRHFRAKRDSQDWDWSFDWRDVSAEEHLTQFTFAKAARLDVLQAVRAEVDRAIAEGRTLRQFVAELKPRLQKLGWWGEKEMRDPRTGETRIVEIGPRRLSTILDTNLRMAHARGRWERIQALKEDMPYLRYVATLDARTRPDHRRWHGTVLPVDDDWWRSHYPPNGWRCRCVVQQLSGADLDRRRIRVSPRPDDGDREWVNRRTGEVSRVPAGIDPGFERGAGSYAPAPAAAKFLEGKIDAAPPPIKEAAAKTLLDDPVAYGAEGNAVRKDIGAAKPEKTRMEIKKRLVAERGAGKQTAPVVAEPDDDPAQFARNEARAESMRAASRLFPASWVTAGPLRVRAMPAGQYGGTYNFAAARATVDDDFGTAVHEYVHHLQATLPGFQRIFRKEHVRRTTNPDGTRKPLVSIGYSSPGRKGGYVDDYMGLDYQATLSGTEGDPDLSDGDGLELPTRGYQILFHDDLHGQGDKLGEMAQDDPGTLDLLLGVLFKYDP